MIKKLHYIKLKFKRYNIHHKNYTFLLYINYDSKTKPYIYLISFESMRNSGHTEPTFGHNWLKKCMYHSTTDPTTLYCSPPTHTTHFCYLPGPRSNHFSTGVRMGALNEGTTASTHKDRQLAD